LSNHSALFKPFNVHDAFAAAGLVVVVVGAVVVLLGAAPTSAVLSSDCSS